MRTDKSCQELNRANFNASNTTKSGSDTTKTGSNAYINFSSSFAVARDPFNRAITVSLPTSKQRCKFTVRGTLKSAIAERQTYRCHSYQAETYQVVMSEQDARNGNGNGSDDNGTNSAKFAVTRGGIKIRLR